MKLGSLDWTIIGIYIAGMFAVGFWAMTRIKDPGGFLLGKRKMGNLMMIAALFAGGVSSNHPISVSSASYRNGFSGIWISLAYMFVMPFLWLKPPVFRRARIVTMVDFLRLRYGEFMGVLFNVFILISGGLAIGIGIKTASVVVHVMSGGAMGEGIAQLLIVAAILLYAIPGGVIAAYATDIVQGLLIIALSFLMIPFAAARVGGFSGLHERVPEHFFQLISDETSATGFGIEWIVWFTIATVFSAFAANVNASFGAARNEMAARLSILGLFAKRFCTLGWMIVGVFALGMFGVGAIDPDTSFAAMSAELLPVGLRGLMVASILAAVMSTVDAQMIHISSIITNNIYRPLIKPQASPSHYLLVARLAGIVVVLIGWVVALQVGSIVKFVIILEQLVGLIGVSIFGAMVWRRATRAGAVASVAVMSPLFLYGTMREGWTLVQWTPLYLIPGILTFVIVSMLTKQHNDRQVMEFYARLDTPLGEEQRLRDQGIEVDLLENLDGESVTVAAKDADISRRLLMLDFFTWPYLVLTGRAKLSDYTVDLVGFIGTIIAVALFIWGCYWIAGLGA